MFGKNNINDILKNESQKTFASQDNINGLENSTTDLLYNQVVENISNVNPIGNLDNKLEAQDEVEYEYVSVDENGQEIEDGDEVEYEYIYVDENGEEIEDGEDVEYVYVDEDGKEIEIENESEVLQNNIKSNMKKSADYVEVDHTNIFVEGEILEDEYYESVLIYDIESKVEDENTNIVVKNLDEDNLAVDNQEKLDTNETLTSQIQEMVVEEEIKTEPFKDLNDDSETDSYELEPFEKELEVCEFDELEPLEEDIEVSQEIEEDTIEEIADIENDELVAELLVVVENLDNDDEDFEDIIHDEIGIQELEDDIDDLEELATQEALVYSQYNEEVAPILEVEEALVVVPEQEIVEVVPEQEIVEVVPEQEIVEVVSSPVVITPVVPAPVVPEEPTKKLVLVLGLIDNFVSTGLSKKNLMQISSLLFVIFDKYKDNSANTKLIEASIKNLTTALNYAK